MVSVLKRNFYNIASKQASNVAEIAREAASHYTVSFL
jgi:hypothetical protein